MGRRTLLIAVVALMLIAAACGDDDGTAAPSTTVTPPTDAPASTAGSSATEIAPPETTTTTQVAEDPEIVWITDFTGTLARISLPESSCEVAQVGWSADEVIVAHGFVWVTDCRGGQVVRFDPATTTENGRLDLGSCPTGLSATDDSIWVALAEEELAVEFDPVTGARLAGVPVPGLITMTAWNPAFFTGYHSVFGHEDHTAVRGGEPLSEAAWDVDWGYAKEVFRSAVDRAAEVFGFSSNHDTGESVTNHVRAQLGSLSLEYIDSYPGIHMGATFGEVIVTIERTVGGFTVIDGADRAAWAVGRPIGPAVDGLVGVGDGEAGEFLLFDPADLTGGVSIEDLVNGPGAPPLSGQPAVTAYPVGEWCEGLAMNQATMIGPRELQRQAELASAVDVAAFPQDPIPELGPADRGVYLSGCGMNLEDGQITGFSFSLSEPEPGIEIVLDLVQGDTAVPGLGSGISDDDGKGTIDVAPDPGDHDTIDTTEPYEWNLRFAAEPPGSGCPLPVNP